MEPELDHPDAEPFEKILKDIENGEKRRKHFCHTIKDAIELRTPNVEVLIMQLTRCKSLFPSVDSFDNRRYFMEFTLEHGLLAMLKALHKNGMAPFNSIRWEDGKSSVHYLVERAAYNYLQFHDLILYILECFTVNHWDVLGFTLLHGACATGRVDLVRKFMGANGQLAARGIDDVARSRSVQVSGLRRACCAKAEPIRIAWTTTRLARRARLHCTRSSQPGASTSTIREDRLRG
ncbi:hypothetical protein TKK_0010497 [Trichogramma kaykai]|uniref:Uncharacterized protein n=1 Tax=Trichogramma kaykai TaxID=54128 RepID=A0ABD2WX10_9HYME